MKQKTALSSKHLPTKVALKSSNNLYEKPNSMNESNIIKCKSILSYISQLLLVSNSMNKNNIRCKSTPSYIIILPLISNSMKENIIIICRSILRYIIMILS